MLLASTKGTEIPGFFPRKQDMHKTWFKEPVFLIRVPFEKLDQAPPAQ